MEPEEEKGVAANCRPGSEPDRIQMALAVSNIKFIVYYFSDGFYQI